MYSITGKYLYILLQKCINLSQLNGLPFEVYDLFRAKCSGNMHEIRQVYNNLCSNPKFTVFRVKNRLNTGNRDFLVNFT